MIQYHFTPGLKILFIGINPHPGSHRRGVPFSNNKMFWYLLHEAGLLKEGRDELRNDAQLKELYTKRFGPKYHYGLVNMVDRPSRTITELKKGEEIVGRARLQTIIAQYHPRVVCFVGKQPYRLFIGQSKVEYGWQASIGGSKIYMMHTPLHGPAAVRISELKEVGRAAGVL